MNLYLIESNLSTMLAQFRILYTVNILNKIIRVVQVTRYLIYPEAETTANGTLFFIARYINCHELYILFKI